MNLFRLSHKERFCQRRREHGKFVLTPISKEEHKRLRARKLIEGRYPSLYVSSHVAAVTGEKAMHIKNKGFDDDYYQTMVLEFIKKYGSASRKDINDLLMEKLPEVLNKQQRLNPSSPNLLSKTSKNGLFCTF